MTILFGVVVVLLSVGWALTLAYGRYEGKIAGRVRRITLNGVDVASSFALGLGLVSLILPFALAQWIHGSEERYLWIIHGPYPYSTLGGLIQVWIDAGLLAVGGALIGLGLLARRWLVKARDGTNPPPTL